MTYNANYATFTILTKYETFLKMGEGKMIEEKEVQFIPYGWKVDEKKEAARWEKAIEEVKAMSFESLNSIAVIM